MHNTEKKDIVTIFDWELEKYAAMMKLREAKFSKFKQEYTQRGGELNVYILYYMVFRAMLYKCCKLK